MDVFSSRLAQGPKYQGPNYRQWTVLKTLNCNDTSFLMLNWAEDMSPLKINANSPPYQVPPSPPELPTWSINQYPDTPPHLISPRAWHFAPRTPSSSPLTCSVFPAQPLCLPIYCCHCLVSPCLLYTSLDCFLLNISVAKYFMKLSPAHWKELYFYTYDDLITRIEEVDTFLSDTLLQECTLNFGAWNDLDLVPVIEWNKISLLHSLFNLLKQRKRAGQDDINADVLYIVPDALSCDKYICSQ